MSDAAQSRLGTLSELVAPVDDKIAVKKDSNLPYVGLEHIGQRNSLLQGWAASETSVSVNSVFEAGDVLFGKLRPNLRKCVSAPFSGYCSTDILVLRSRNGHDPGFAARVFQTEAVGAEAERTSMGTKMPRTSWKGLSQFRVPIPEPRHQSKIAEVLDTLDAAIRGTEVVVAELRAMKQGLLHDLLTRGIDANGDLRPPQLEAPHLYKQTPLGWLPKEWSTYKLPGLSMANRPVIRTGPFGSSLKGEHWREVGRPVITIGSFGDNSFIMAELLFIDEKKALGMLEYEVLPGDLVFSRVADVGRSLVVNDDQAGWIMSSNLMRISVEPRKLMPNLLHAQLRHSTRLRKQMSQLVNSAGRDVANSAVLLALDIVAPPPAEQAETSQVIKANEAALASEEVQLDKLRLQKFGLMDDLLTGRVPVTPLL